MCVIMHIDKSPAIVMGRPACSSQQNVPRLLSSALHHNYHLPSHLPSGPEIIHGEHTHAQSSLSSHPVTPCSTHPTLNYHFSSRSYPKKILLKTKARRYGIGYGGSFTPTWLHFTTNTPLYFKNTQRYFILLQKCSTLLTLLPTVLTITYYQFHFNSGKIQPQSKTLSHLTSRVRYVVVEVY